MVNQFGESVRGVSKKVSLSGDDKKIVSRDKQGAKRIVVSSRVVGGPSLICDVIKSIDEVYIKNVAANPAADECAIGIFWTEYIEIAKSKNTFDGIYDVTVI